MKIVIYSKKNCQFCGKAKDLVKKLGLEYTEKSLEKDFGSDPSKLIEDIGKRVMSMPRFKIDDELIVGYNHMLEYFVEIVMINFQVDVIDNC